MTKEMEFFTFLLEQYAAYKETTADIILKQFDNLNLTDFIMNMYEMYHSEAIQNAFDDIDLLIAEKSKKKSQKSGSCRQNQTCFFPKPRLK